MQDTEIPQNIQIPIDTIKNHENSKYSFFRDEIILKAIADLEKNIKLKIKSDRDTLQSLRDACDSLLSKFPQDI